MKRNGFLLAARDRAAATLADAQRRQRTLKHVGVRPTNALVVRARLDEIGATESLAALEFESRRAGPFAGREAAMLELRG